MQAKTLLGLKEDLMNGADPTALELLESCWETAGRPQGEKELLAVLKRVLDRCVREGITYPRIFLKRKSELARGTFKPRTELTGILDPSAVRFTAELHPKVPASWIEQAIEQSKKDFESRTKARFSVSDKNELCQPEIGKNPMFSRET